MRKRILIIEDEENLLELLRINIERRDFDVEYAITGEEGLQRAMAHPPDALLLDVRLPGMDGWEVCRRLREHPATKDLTIIFLTAAAQKEDRENAFASGGDYFLTKPFDMGYLIEILNNAGEPSAQAHHSNR